MNVIRARAVHALLFSLCALLVSTTSGCGSAPQTATTGLAESSNTNRGERPPDRYDLERDEHRGGHTLNRHVGRSDAELQERLQRERNISAASTWTDQRTAEETVASALREERRKIENWAQRGERRPNLALHYDAGRPIGRSLRRGESEAVVCTRAVIVLRADGTEGFYVLTTYPEARE